MASTSHGGDTGGHLLLIVFIVFYLILGWAGLTLCPAGRCPRRRWRSAVSGYTIAMTPSKPMLGFAAFSGTGKTTLLEKLIPLLTAQGIRIGMVKHAHHEFDIDKPGKDSHRLRMAGARQMLIASSKRQALMTENPEPREPQLDELIGHLDLDNTDLVLVEGFKHVPFPKIELHRKALGKSLLYRDDPNIIAVASDHAGDVDGLPSLDINDTGAIATFILMWMQAEQGLDSRAGGNDDHIF
jgi:molybdopterin-guanine dinucleotide biosynthesis protein MobB